MTYAYCSALPNVNPLDNPPLFQLLCLACFRLGLPPGAEMLMPCSLTATSPDLGMFGVFEMKIR
jgi:hypothetical protein